MFRVSTWIVLLHDLYILYPRRAEIVLIYYYFTIKYLFNTVPNTELLQLVY